MRETQNSISSRIWQLAKDSAKNIRAWGILWPSWLFILILFALLLMMSQGQDIMQFTLEEQSRMAYAGFSAIFAALITWYTLRLLGFAYLCSLDAATFVSRHTGRFMGFSVFTVLSVAFWKAATNAEIAIEDHVVILIVSILVYSVFIQIGSAINSRRRTLNYTVVAWFLCWILMFLGVFISASFSDGNDVLKLPYVIGGLLLTQFSFSIHMICRREWTATIRDSGVLSFRFLYFLIPSILSSSYHWLKNQVFEGLYLVNKCCYDERDRVKNMLRADFLYFIIFNIVSGATMIIIWHANSDIPFACAGGPLTWVLIGLAGILGTINLFRSLSRTLGVGLYTGAIIWIIVAGIISDLHEVEQPETPVTVNADRFTFLENLYQWRASNSHIASSDSIPMIFVMADGGALRSGYWATLIYEELDQQLNGEFGRNVFCYSGASGGSTGNAVYYSAMQENGYKEAGSLAAKVLCQDIFSFTIARMLYNDIWNMFIPVLPDRGDGLNDAFHHAGIKWGDSLNLNKPFSAFLTEYNIDTVGVPDWSPILCMNTTRMQDASAAVISTMDIARSQELNHRVDVFDRKDAKTTLSMVTMGTLGSRFPYVSPGGGVRVDPSHYKPDHSGLLYDYYVDGGYMDNSGAGIVLEMIMGLDKQKKIDSQLSNIHPYIFHITNTSKKDEMVGPVHPLINDLAAPIQTVIGSYGAQTDVLTDRLIRYLQSTGRDTEQHYIELNLFAHYDKPISYNWLMSNEAKETIDNQLPKQVENLEKVVEISKKLIPQ